jgi:hypothetical protein
MFFRAASFPTFHHAVQYQLRNSSNSIKIPSPQQLLYAGGFTGFVISFIEVR